MNGSLRDLRISSTSTLHSLSSQQQKYLTVTALIIKDVLRYEACFLDDLFKQEQLTEHSEGIFLLFVVIEVHDALKHHFFAIGSRLGNILSSLSIGIIIFLKP